MVMPVTEVVDADTEMMDVMCGNCGSGDLDVCSIDIFNPRAPNGPWYVRCNECRTMNRITTETLAAAGY